MMQFYEHICSIGLVQPSTSQNCGVPKKCLVYLGYHSPKTNGWKIPQNHGFGSLKKPPALNMAMSSIYVRFLACIQDEEL